MSQNEAFCDTVHRNQENREELHQVAHLQFDKNFLYLPSFHTTYLKFDNNCLRNAKSMQDICKCQKGDFEELSCDLGHNIQSVQETSTAYSRKYC